MQSIVFSGRSNEDAFRAEADLPVEAVRVIEAGPLTVCIQFADRSLESLFAPAFYPSHVASPSGREAWTLHVRSLSPGESLPLVGFRADEPDMRLAESPDRYALWMGRHSSCLYGVDRPSRRAVCWIADQNAVKAWERSRPFLPALQAMLDPTPWIAVHAAALAWDNRAILFSGPGRAGKTTLSLAGLSADWRFLGDDYVAVLPGEDGAVAPLFATARLREDMVERFPNLAAARAEVSDDFGERRHELILQGFGQLRAGPVPLGRIVFVERGGSPTPDLGLVLGSQVLVAIAANTFIATPGAKELRLRKIARLLTALPPARFDPGPDLGAALAYLKGVSA